MSKILTLFKPDLQVCFEGSKLMEKISFFSHKCLDNEIKMFKTFDKKHYSLSVFIFCATGILFPTDKYLLDR